MADTVLWVGCDLISGEIIEELHDLRPTGPLRRLLGEDQSMQFTLPLSKQGTHGGPPPAWVEATVAGKTIIVAVLNGRPVWGGIVLVRQGGTTPLLSLGTVTCEGYLARRYVGDHRWVQKDEASVIAAGLIADAQLEGIGLVVDAPPTGRKRDREYFYKDNKSVMSALQELAGVIDGIEWTIDLEWGDATETWVRKIIRVRKRIGVMAPTTGPVVTFEGTAAAAVFETAGAASVAYEYAEDYSDGRGANHIVAWSSGEGEDQPFGSPARDEELLAAGWPRYEERFQPSTSISNIATLNEHAAERLALIGRGITALTLKARADVYPRLDQDWRLGDEVGYHVVGHWHRDGLAGTARAIGWEYEPQLGTVEPLLLTPPGGFLVPATPNWVANPSFELSTEDWLAAGAVPPTIARSATRSHDGAWSLLVTWQGGSAPNLITNPGFETNTAGWVQLSNWNTIARSTVQKRTGVASLLGTQTVQDTGDKFMSWVTTPNVGAIAIVAGGFYVGKGWFRAAVGRQARLRFAWYNTAGTYLPGLDVYSAYAPLTAGVWTELTISATAPPGAGRVALECRVGSPIAELGNPAVGELVYFDDAELRLTGGGLSPQVSTALENMVPGQRYNAAAWVWVTPGGRPVQLAVEGIGYGAPSTLEGSWQQITYSFTATATGHSLQLWPVAPVVGGESVYFDEVEVTAAT